MISGQKIPLTAGGAITARHIVKVGAADLAAVQATAATDVLIGVAEFDADSGATATVQVAGVAFVEAGGTITRGARVTSNASGQGVVAAPAAGVNNGVVGVALDAAVTGDYFRVALSGPGAIMQGA